jgi:hypothetical protein
MNDLKNARIKLVTSSWRVRIVVILTNFLLWLAPKLLKHDPEKMEREIEDVLKTGIKTLLEIKNQENNGTKS